MMKALGLRNVPIHETGIFLKLKKLMISPHIRLDLHPISEPEYQHQCRFILEKEGALVLKDFFSKSSVREVVQASSGREAEAFYANSTHNVYLTPVNQELADTHPFNSLNLYIQ